MVQELEMEDVVAQEQTYSGTEAGYIVASCREVG
jgi:hypothetical protein